MKWIERNRCVAPKLFLLVVAIIVFCCFTSAQTPPKPSPKKFALVIGIDKYPISPLQGCVRDAERVQEALVRIGGFREEDISLLTDDAATYKGILQSLVGQYQKAQRGDLFVFYFSGHGTLFPDEQSVDRDEKTEIEPPNLIPGKYDGALCPIDIDAEINSSGNPWENLLLDDTLAWHFSRFTRKGCSVIFISDSCHSGAQARNTDSEFIPKKLDLLKTIHKLKDKRAALESVFNQERIKDSLNQIPLPTLSRDVNSYDMRGQYLLLASSRDIQESGASKAGSLFTNALLEVMQNSPKATIKETYEQVARKVKQISLSKDRLQEPRMDSRYYSGSLEIPFLSLPTPPEAGQSIKLKVSVRVINEKGAAIRTARVAILPSRGKVPVAIATLMADGSFETKTLLKPEEYRLRVEAKGFPPFEDRVELAESSRKGKASFTVRLKKP